MGTDMTGTGIYDGFEKFVAPGREETIEALRSALVVIDTNVLLSLYKFDQDTRGDYLEALSKLGDRLWVPNQVMLEFWRSRRPVLVTIRQSYAGVRKTFRSIKNQVDAELSRVAPVMAAEDFDALGPAFSEVFAQVDAILERQISALVDPATPTRQDDVLNHLEPVLKFCVEPGPDPHDRERWLAEGAARIAIQRPPGYLDAGKEDRGSSDGGSGDYLVWLAAMTEAKRRNLDLLVITGDVKEDWWVRHEADVIGPRPELVEEYRDFSEGRSVFLLRPQEFLTLSRDWLGAQISDASIEQVNDLNHLDAEAEGKLDTFGDLPWTAEGVHEMLARLEARPTFQAEVIREAAKHGGRIGRKAILRKAHRKDTGRSLQGVTRPVFGVQERLVAEGVIPAGTEPMLTVHYEGSQLSQLSIPTSVVQILRDDPQPTPDEPDTADPPSEPDSPATEDNPPTPDPQ